MPLYITYYPKDQLESLSARQDVLGIVGYDTHPPVFGAGIGIPMAGGGGGMCEVWHGGAVLSGHSNETSYAEDGEWLFAAVHVEEAAGGIEEAARRAYARLLAVLAERGYRHLIRVWQYFSHINDAEGDLERYRAFNRGRHAALTSYLEAGGQRPAATAIGCEGAGLHLYALGRRDRGVAVENPRQIPAFCYPRQYGPRAPDFTRAMRVEGDRRYLFISGTAAIVGHESHHAGDLQRQIDETVRNLDAVLAASGLQAPEIAAVKIYVRPGQESPVLPGRWGQAPTLVLTSAICRAELLVETEAVVVDTTQTR